MYYFEDKEFGKVYVSIRANMRNITVRWKGGVLYMNAPHGTGERQLRDVLDKFREKLRKKKDDNTVSYHIGQVIQCYRLTLTIGEQDKKPNLILFGHSRDNVDVLVPKGIDLSEPRAQKWVSRALRSALDAHAANALIPLAQSVSKSVGVAPVRYEIGHGLRKLGHCTPDKVIQLSANLMFLPEELIKLTICHELAHLTHMNHSPQFHALVDKYLDGRERDLERKLKAFHWPVI
jgi:predicted metal-dependent hydrolase